MSDYVQTLQMFAGKLGPAQHMADALKNNRELKAGKKKSRKMSPNARAFCAFLVSGRRQRLMFQSLHIRLFKMSKALMETATVRMLSRSEQETLRQTGTLAAMVAIWLWFCPLRIDNMQRIPLTGPLPWLFMPDSHRDHARLLIPAEYTKTNKTIDHKLDRNRSRALEIMEWYLLEIRPRYAAAAASPYLFPGCRKGSPTISGTSIRLWLRKYCRAVAFYQMNPQWFRHGVASLYLQANPGAYIHAATLLDNTTETVRRHYGFIDDERLLDEAQANWLKLADFLIENPDADPEDWKCR